jgi:hypothetical protein
MDNYRIPSMSETVPGLHVPTAGDYLSILKLGSETKDLKPAHIIINDDAFHTSLLRFDEAIDWINSNCQAYVIHQRGDYSTNNLYFLEGDAKAREFQHWLKKMYDRYNVVISFSRQEDHKPILTEMADWLEECDIKSDYSRQNLAFYLVIRFEDPEDTTAFRLRWHEYIRPSS